MLRLLAPNVVKGRINGLTDWRIWLIDTVFRILDSGFRITNYGLRMTHFPFIIRNSEYRIRNTQYEIRIMKRFYTFIKFSSIPGFNPSRMINATVSTSMVLNPVDTTMPGSSASLKYIDCMILK